jgi:hypothetical protein
VCAVVRVAADLRHLFQLDKEFPGLFGSVLGVQQLCGGCESHYGVFRNAGTARHRRQLVCRFGRPWRLSLQDQ